MKTTWTLRWTRRILTLTLALCVACALALPVAAAPAEPAHHPVGGSKLQLNRHSLKLAPGARFQLEATAPPQKAVQKVKWSSEDKTVATVTSKGLVKAEKAGRTVLVATAPGGRQARCKVTVKAGVHHPKNGTAWVPKTGKKYHSGRTCGNMKGPRRTTAAKARAGGYMPCKKCW